MVQFWNSRSLQKDRSQGLTLYHFMTGHRVRKEGSLLLLPYIVFDTLHCIVQPYIVSCCLIMYHAAWQCIVPLYIVLRQFTLYCATLHCILQLGMALCSLTLYCAALHCIVLLCIVMCHFILCCATLHCIVQLYTVFCCFKTASHCSLENGPQLMFDIALWNFETASLFIWKKESLLNLSTVSIKNSRVQQRG